MEVLLNGDRIEAMRYVGAGSVYVRCDHGKLAMWAHGIGEKVVYSVAGVRGNFTRTMVQLPQRYAGGKSVRFRESCGVATMEVLE
jgi:cell division protein FtsX